MTSGMPILPSSSRVPSTRTSRFVQATWTNLSISSSWRDLRTHEAFDDLAGDQVDQSRDPPVHQQGVLRGLEPEQILERADKVVAALQDPAHDLVALVGLVERGEQRTERKDRGREHRGQPDQRRDQ